MCTTSSKISASSWKLLAAAAESLGEGEAIPTREFAAPRMAVERSILARWSGFPVPEPLCLPRRLRAALQSIDEAFRLHRAKAQANARAGSRER